MRTLDITSILWDFCGSFASAEELDLGDVGIIVPAPVMPTMAPINAAPVDTDAPTMRQGGSLSSSSSSSSSSKDGKDGKKGDLAMSKSSMGMMKAMFQEENCGLR